jgi:hypothetical protein
MRRRNERARQRLLAIVLLAVLYFVLGAREANARSCDGPTEWCPPAEASWSARFAWVVP